MQLIFTTDPLHAPNQVTMERVPLGQQRYMDIYLVHHEPHLNPVRTVLYIRVPARTLHQIRIWLHQDQAFYGDSGQITVIY